MKSPKTQDLCYPVLTAIKFRGKFIKPPAFIQLSGEEAAPLIADGYLGDEGQAALPPDDENDDPNSEAAAGAAGAAAIADADPAKATARTDATAATASATATPTKGARVAKPAKKKARK